MEIYYKKCTNNDGVDVYTLYIRYNGMSPKELCYTYSEAKANWLLSVLGNGLRF